MVTVAFMEDQLKKLCEVVAARRNYNVRFTDMKGSNGFTACVAYLQKVLDVSLSEDHFGPVRGIVDVRNIWVHHGGHPPDGVLPKYLGSMKTHVDLKNGQIQFVGPFVQEACKHCVAFVQEVEASIKAKAGPRRL